MTYTYDDIVTAKDILTGRVKEEDIIGKKGWFFNSMPGDMNLNFIMRVAGNPKVLKLVDANMLWPFEDKCDCYTYFLPKKEESAPEPEIYGTAIEEGPHDKEKSYEERQAEWVKANNLKPGDKVRILRGFETYEDGFSVRMGVSMRELVGEVLTVKKVRNLFIAIWNEDHSNWWLWPYFVLEKVDEPAYIPFDLSKPEDRDTLRDKWVKSNNPDVFHEFKITQFIRMNDDHQTIYVKAGTNRYSGGDLFCDYIFADGSPVGKIE